MVDVKSKEYDKAWHIIEEAIEEMDQEEAVLVWDNFVDDNRRGDDYIFSMEEFNEIMCGEEPESIALMIHYGRFNPTDRWFGFNGYGNLISTDYPKEDWLYPNEVADWLLEEAIQPEEVIKDGLTEEEVREIIVAAAML